MKKFIVFAIIFVLLLSLVSTFQWDYKQDFVRIHIRADSNDEEAQRVKYAVKSAVCDYLTPHLANCQNANQVKTLLNNHKKNLEQIATNVLKDWGFDYTATATLKQEYFPARTYGSLTLESGVYWAFVVNLGSGKGDNWWCVAYPPLCFVNAENLSAENVIYKSKLMELIDDWFNQD